MMDLLTEKQLLDFSVISGTIFSLSTTVEYLDECKPIMGERKANYAINKTKEAYTACNKLLIILESEFKKTLSQETKDMFDQNMDRHKALVYKMFTLDEHDQKRVTGLINKLINEK